MEIFYIYKCTKVLKGLSMSITVGDIYTKFPNFKPQDMIDLVGSSNFDGRTQISLSKIASYKGGYSQELNVFTAAKEGKAFTEKLSSKHRQEVNDLAGIEKPQNGIQNSQGTNVPKLPMDVSVFDYPKA